eukprot:scaffold7993_cov239-Pinguiococcus_pyrenoidosus.AAC.2
MSATPRHSARDAPWSARRQRPRGLGRSSKPPRMWLLHSLRVISGCQSGRPSANGQRSLRIEAAFTSSFGVLKGLDASLETPHERCRMSSFVARPRIEEQGSCARRSPSNLWGRRFLRRRDCPRQARIGRRCSPAEASHGTGRRRAAGAPRALS